MLPRRDRSPGRCPLVVLTALLAAAALLLAGRPARAAEGDKPANSLSLVPADAAYYGSMLRNKEQVDAVLKSKAFKRLRELDLVQMGLKHLSAELGKEDSPAAKVKQFFDDPENKELLELLKDAGSHEIFLYGGGDWTDLLTSLIQAYNSATFAPAQAALSGGDPNKAQLRAALRSLQKNRARLKVPDLVFGFKLTDTKRAESQIKRLEKLLTGLVKDAPELKGKIKRTKVGDSSFLTVTVDGSMARLDEVPWGEVEENAGEFDELKKHLKGLTLTASLGVRHGYLLFGITSSAKDLEKIGGEGKHLADRDEVKPLARHAKEKIVSLSYASKDFRSKLVTSGSDYSSLAAQAKELLAKADIPEAKRRAIEKDLDAMVKDLKGYVPKVGARFAFDFLTDDGIEGYSYDYSDHAALKGVKFTLLDHLGGNPVLALGGAHRSDPKGYDTFAKWVKVAYGHADDILTDKLPPEAKDKYEEFKKVFLPLVKRLDQTTRTNLIPSVGNSSALVVDAKWTSKQWQRDLPPMPKAMPMLELAVVCGLKDSDKFVKALREYRVLFNDAVAKVGEVNPMVPENVREFKLPAAKTAKDKSGTLYFYPLPEAAGVDKQVAPTLGVSKNVAAFALSNAHARRLLTATPLKAGGPLAEKRDLVGVAYVNWPAFVDLVGPWVEFGVKTGLSARPEPEGGAAAARGAALEAPKPEDVIKQVRVVLDVLKAFQNYSSATYLEGGALVTHSKTVIKDR
jgi:hypothetical protein